MHAFIDGVLMGPGKSGEYQLAGIGMTHVNLHFAAALVYVNDFPDIFDVQFRIHPLGEHVVRNSQDIHIAGTLSIAEKGSLHAVRPCQQSQLCGGHAAAPVIMGMHA